MQVDWTRLNKFVIEENLTIGKKWLDLYAEKKEMLEGKGSICGAFKCLHRGMPCSIGRHGFLR